MSERNWKIFEGTDCAFSRGAKGRRKRLWSVKGAREFRAERTIESLHKQQDGCPGRPPTPEAAAVRTREGCFANHPPPKPSLSLTPVGALQPTSPSILSECLFEISARTTWITRDVVFPPPN